MEHLHNVPPSVEGQEEYSPPPLIIDGISITDAKGWSFLRNSPHVSEEVELAIQLATEIESTISAQYTLSDVWEEKNQSIRSEADSRTLHKAIIILKKHWLFGEELYELYKTVY